MKLPVSAGEFGDENFCLGRKLMHAMMYVWKTSYFDERAFYETSYFSKRVTHEIFCFGRKYMHIMMYV